MNIGYCPSLTKTSSVISLLLSKSLMLYCPVFGDESRALSSLEESPHPIVISRTTSVKCEIKSDMV